jgi:hypothetical protein
MAVLKAPLLSFGASGQIAKTVVYFPWKGLNVARKHVVPSNPKSVAQVAHRALLTAAVLEIHNAMVYAVHPLNSADKSAYSLAGSLHPTPRTWFNEAAKIMIDAQVDAQTYSAIVDGTTVYLAPTTATVALFAVKNAAHTGFIKYGTSKSALLSSIAADIAAHTFTGTLTGLTLGVTYYWQWQATPVAGKTVLKSGIYVYTHKV